MALNRQSPLPLYLQLSGILRDQIRGGQYAPGSRIPSEPELSRRYGLGRPTVRQAIGQLAREGSLVRRRGSGTFVRESPAEIDLFSLAGTSSAFSEKGIVLSQRMLKKIMLTTVPAEEAGAGGTADPHSSSPHPFSGRRVYFFSRLSLHGTEPVLLEETWLDPGLFPGIDGYDFAKLSLSRIVRERYFLAPETCRQTFRAGFDRARGAVLKAGRAEPLLIAERSLNFTDHPPGIHSLLFCRTGRFTFSQILRGGLHDA